MISSKKYQEYKPSDINFIGDIPNHWEVRKLKFVSKSIQTGSTPASKKGDYFTDGIINWYSPSDFNSDFILDNSIKKVIEKAIKDKEVKLYNKGSILFTGVGTVGKVGLLKESSSCNQQINIITPNSQFLSSYAIYLLYIIGLEVRKFAKATILPIFNQDETKALKIILPPLKEQEKIVNFLDTKNKQIEEFIKDKQNQISLLKEQKEAIINKAVTKGLDDSVEFKNSGIEWIGNIPKCWGLCKLKYLSKRISDGIHATPQYTDNTNYYFINGNNLDNGKINITQNTRSVDYDEYIKHQRDLNSQTILISINGTIGNLAYYNNETVVLGKSSAYINLNEDINKEFIFLLLQAEYVKEFFQIEYTGSTIKNISLATIKNIPIPLPPREEQKEIIKYIETETSKIDEVINQIQNEIDLIQEYKISLISEVVTGQIDVR